MLINFGNKVKVKNFSTFDLGDRLMNTQNVVSKEIIAHDFLVAMHGKFDQDKIDATVASLKSTTTKYPANGSITGFIFYFRIQVNVTGGKSFNGNAGALGTVGGGALFGDVYTDDINELYNNTVSFQFQSTPVYFSILFFDGNSKLLGHFQSGAVSTIVAVGGGTGNWS
jgi:hypothetical protein